MEIYIDGPHRNYLPDQQKKSKNVKNELLSLNNEIAVLNANFEKQLKSFKDEIDLLKQEKIQLLAQIKNRNSADSTINNSEFIKIEEQNSN